MTPEKSSLIGLSNSSDPLVTVVVATYNWPEALACSLQSIRQQRFENYEVLVVGDACTDESEAVVTSLSDRRFLWHNLPTRSGNQFGPNNYALEKANAQWIAYCGHDDIWHPDHLATLLETAEQNNVEAVAATVLMYGPAGSGFFAMAGQISGDQFSERDFVPPSGLMHRRALVEKVGQWADVNSIAMPVDCEFEARIIKATRVVPSRQLTVFKFNAASRRDAYRLRNVDDQKLMLEKIAGGREFRHEELLLAMRAASRGLFHHIEMPELPNFLPGELASRQRRHKGVDPRFDELIPVTAPTWFGCEQFAGQFEWHGIEKKADGKTYRWTGPMVQSVADLPVTCGSCLSIEIAVEWAIAPEILDTLRIEANGQSVEFQRIKRADGGLGFRFNTLADSEAAHLSIAICVSRTYQPLSFGGKDRRWLGLAVSGITVAPLNSEAETFSAPNCESDLT